MKSPAPLIKSDYIHNITEHSGVSNPFDFPLDFDTSGQLYISDEMKIVCKFLYLESSNKETLISSTKELEKLIQWTWRIKSNSLLRATREDGLEYIKFIKSPPATWIGKSPYKKYLPDGSPNFKWRPFLNRKSGLYEVSESSLQKTITVMDRFYEYLDDESYTQINPFSGIRKKISLIRTTQEAVEIKRITNFQWDYVMRSANALADNDAKYERHLFVITLLKTQFLRVSDFAPCYETIPKMNDFVKTTEGWIFKALGKGNKLRNIALKDVSLDALKRYRSALGLSILPTPSDDSYLLPLSSKRKKPYISSTRSIQQHVDMIFKHAINRMMEDGLEEESLELQSASSHWLRHTGISEDVKTRPLNDVRMDAGHSTIATTTGYMGSTLQERIESAKNQPL